ncbi:MAG: hypothetical protein A2140_01880 [Candidatus Muproteobacteria bacterium RBG_16_62_13]|uniref:Uncharacterized protein n=1 Tax=Candidatus Muproteobacteria bacterium RBG_16_62_13 TaxID=1817756 RepID=A0A1F6SX04_9PROT|nr:MAG: hypothetical protein A2140_01880 [Candidatus Muproteobacteria bacterium RBG_16_62_13]
MAGSLSCPHCQRSVPLHSADSGYLICPHCRRGSTHAGGKLARHAAAAIAAPSGASLGPGDALVVQGRHYTIGGIVQYRDCAGNRSTDYDLIGKGDEIVGLEEADGEWTLNRYLPNGERLVKKTEERAELFKQSFPFDARYPVEVTAAAGEFEEPVAAGDQARFDYYEGSEYGLTAEVSPAGKVLAWYLSYPLRADEIRAPAGRKLSASAGIGGRLSGFLGLSGTGASASSATGKSPLAQKPATGSQIVRWSLIFAAIAVVLHLLFMVTAQNKKVYDSGPRATGAATQSSWISEPFELTGRRSNVEVLAQTSLSNQWMGFDLALVNKTSGKVFHIYEDAGHWHGYDGGERWSEGTSRPEFYFSSIPAGTYVFEVVTHADVPNIQYQLVLNRDVPRSSYLLYILIAFAALPGLYLLRRYAKN